MTVQGVLATLIPVLGLIGALMLFLIRESKDAGRRESKLDELLADVHELRDRLKVIPDIERRVGQIEAVNESIRSDIRDLKKTRRNSWHDREE